MAKSKKQIRQKLSSKKPAWRIPLTQNNFKIFGLGLFLIIVGFIIMTIQPWDSIFALTISPIILLIAYFNVFPFGILTQKKNNK